MNHMRHAIRTGLLLLALLVAALFTAHLFAPNGTQAMAMAGMPCEMVQTCCESADCPVAQLCCSAVVAAPGLGVPHTVARATGAHRKLGVGTAPLTRATRPELPPPRRHLFRDI